MPKTGLEPILESYKESVLLIKLFQLSDIFQILLGLKGVRTPVKSINSTLL